MNEYNELNRVRGTERCRQININIDKEEENMSARETTEEKYRGLTWIDIFLFFYTQRRKCKIMKNVNCDIGDKRPNKDLWGLISLIKSFKGHSLAVFLKCSL